VALMALFAAAAYGADSLPDAVQRQDSVATNALLAQHADVNATLADGSTALLWAAHWDDPALVDLLLRAGASPKTPNRYGISPLLEACMNGDTTVIEALLKAGADPDTAQREGETALMTASRTGNADAVKMLVDHGAHVNTKENWRGQTALMWAVAEKHPAVVQLLIARGADVNARSRVFDYTGLMPKQGSVPMNYPRGGFTALLFAARQDDLESARALVNAKADVNLSDPDGTTPLLEAIVNFHFDLAAFLLDHGADPNSRDHNGRSALYAAVDMHSLDTSTRPNPTPPDQLNSFDIIKALLAHGANPNARLTAFIPPRGPLDVADYTMGAGATPFLRAAKSDDLEVMRLLLDKGADPLIATNAQVTALMAAAGVGWRDGKSHGAESDAIKAIDLCLDHGADINAATDKGETALHGATMRGANTVISYLVSRGADVNAKNEKGRAAFTDIVQEFSAQVPASGTSTGGHYPSVPATLACNACSGTFTATSSAPWVVITSVANGSISFNVFSNISGSPRTALVQAARVGNKAVLTITQAASTEPLLKRQTALLYQQILGREPAPAQPQLPLGSLAASLLNRPEVRDSAFEVMAMYQAVTGAPPQFPAWLAALQAIRNGLTAESQFASIPASGACTAECIYKNLLGRAPSTSELGAQKSQQPFAIFSAVFNSPEFHSNGGFAADHTNSLYVTMLYHLLLQRAPDPTELAERLKTANATGPGVYFNQVTAQERILAAGFIDDATFMAQFR
jgi:ankyrin repeat protein